MTKLKELKKDLKEAKKELKRGININDNKDLIEILHKEIRIKENLKKKGYKTKLLDKVIKKFDNYDIDAKFLDSVIYAGKNITRFRFDYDKYKQDPFSVKQVQKISNKMSKYLNELGLNGKLMTTMHYGSLGWRPGHFDKIGEDTRLYYPDYIDMDEPPIRSFIIYTFFKQNPAGGNDFNNDCLYNCLSEYIVLLKSYWETPEAFKKYLGLKRNDKVPISLISKVEEKLRTFQINVRGDYIHSSTIKSEKIINLTLINEHYEIDKTYQKKPICKNINYREKQPLLYDKVSFEIYDGKIKRIISKEEKNELMYNFKSPYIVIQRQVQKDKEGNIIELTLEEEFDKLIVINNKLKETSKGLINLFKSGSITNAALDLFDRFTKYLNDPDEILQDESEWISESNIGALIFADIFEGELYKYDVKSLYPSLMQQTTFKFPIKRGEFIKLDTFSEYFQYGIYRCKITPSEDENINKLFRFNKKNYYTSISLDHAKSLNLKIELIHDEEPNFLYYSRDKLITANEVFKPYIEFLFKLKENNIEWSKDILNRLWGALCEVDKRKYYCDKPINISEDEEIVEIYPSKNNEDIDIIKTNKINKKYKTNYARIGPFLLSQGRKHMSNIMFQYRNNIHRCQTDGFLSDIKIHSNTIVKIGELRYEGYTEKGEIKNKMNKVNTHF